MVEREKSEKKVRLCHHQTTVPSTGMVSVFLHRRLFLRNSTHQIEFVRHTQISVYCNCLAWTAKNIGAGEIESHLRPAPPLDSNHEKICILQPAVHYYRTVILLVGMFCEVEVELWKGFWVKWKEIKNVVVGKSKNDNSIENQQIEAAYTSAKCFTNVVNMKVLDGILGHPTICKGGVAVVIGAEGITVATASKYSTLRL